jgi:hypothetical protein
VGFFVLPGLFPMVVVVLLAIEAMECCLFVIWLFFLCFDKYISFKVVHGSDLRSCSPAFF